MISKITTEHIYEYDEHGKITREIEKTTEEYSQDYIPNRDNMWSTVPPFWWLNGPTCDTATPYLIGDSCDCCCDESCDCCDDDCDCCEEECGW